ncbi:MAG: hypothetical protein ACD_80C00199G0001, partial [uncultured bacterium (gcode 4)]
NLTSLNYLSVYNNKLTSLPESLTWLTLITTFSNNLDIYNNCLDANTMSWELFTFVDERQNNNYGDWKTIQNACSEFSCTESMDVPQAECQALVDLYNSTDGDNWNNHDHWFWYTDTVCNNWNGITCNWRQDENGFDHVYQIDLRDTNLVWPIPESVEDMTSLQYVYLNGNKLTSLPESFKNLTNLSETNVAYNNICTAWLSSELADFIDNYAYYDEWWHANDRRSLQDKNACDTDADGILDTQDNCPLVVNPDQTNSDFTGDNEEVIFTKDNYADYTLPENQDCITDNVCITRQDSQGIYNAVSEENYNWSSPDDTEWSYGSCSEKKSLTFDTWINTNDSNPPNMVGRDMCVHLTTDDKYFDIKFTSRTQGSNQWGPGGWWFSYIRKQYNAGDACDCSDNACTPGNDILDNPICTPQEDACYPDTDEDGVYDNKDNCISTYNPDQADSDVIETIFTKNDGADWTLPENQDCINDDVCLTRGDNQQIYNSVYQVWWEQWNRSFNPTNTEWTYGECIDKNSLPFGNLYDVNGGDPTNMINKNMCLHTTTDDKYYNIKFTDWTQGSNGWWFSYRRATEGNGIGDACDLDRVNIYNNEIYPTLIAWGIINNFDQVTSDNVNNFENLYFEKEWYGKIEFQTGLNLQSQEVIEFLQELPNHISIENGYVEFNPIGSGEGFNTSAKISMYFDTLPFGTLDETNPDNIDTYIIVKDISGNVITWMLNNLYCTETEVGQDYCTFDTQHFTSFEFSLPCAMTDDKISTWSATFQCATNTGFTLEWTGILTIVSEEDTDNIIEIPGDIGSITTSGGDRDGNINAPTTVTGDSTGKATTFELSNFLPANTTTTEYSHNIITTVNVGSNVELRATTGYFTISIDVWSTYNNTTINVYRSEDGSTWVENTPDNTCLVTNNICTFRTDHLSYFAPTKIVATTKSWGGGWGGGSIGLVKDVCTLRQDCSSSYYDAVCGPCLIDAKEKEITDNAIHWSAPLGNASGIIIGSTYSQELNDAYQRAYDIGITTMPTIQKADLEGNAYRKHFAKMITEFAIKVLKKQPNTSLACSFIDITKESDEMKFYIKTACQLGLMWWNSDGKSVKTTFDPNNIMTRAEFGTVLSRLLYGNLYNTTDMSKPYYQEHLDSLHVSGIMTDISKPSKREIRGYLMLMLMRAKDSNTSK